MSVPSITPGELLDAVQELTERAPEGSFLIRNGVGNLALQNPQGSYIGYIDLISGEVVILHEET